MASHSLMVCWFRPKSGNLFLPQISGQVGRLGVETCYEIVECLVTFNTPSNRYYKARIISTHNGTQHTQWAKGDKYFETALGVQIQQYALVSLRVGRIGSASPFCIHCFNSNSAWLPGLIRMLQTIVSSSSTSTRTARDLFAHTLSAGALSTQAHEPG